MRGLLGVTLAALALLAPCHARALTGVDLLSACQKVNLEQRFSSVNDAVSSGMCLGVLHGVQEAGVFAAAAAYIRAEAGLDSGPALGFCAPSTTGGQTLMIVLKYLRDNPSKLHNNATFLVISALIEAFPCTR
jgi:hypothetical protein